MLKIIDISRWNTVVNWDKVKADGVDMVIVKATQGHSLSSKDYLFTDSKFHSHMKGAISAGIPVGVYHFFTGNTDADALKEANYFCSVINPYKDKIVFAACDAENYNNPWLNKLSRAELTTRINTFCNRVRQNGYAPIHYTNVDHIRNYINIDQIPFPAWVASYGQTKPVTGNQRMIMWQYTDKGRVAGISGYVDMNHGYFDIDEYVKSDKPKSERLKVGDEVRVVNTTKVLGQTRCKLFGGKGTFRVYYDTYTVTGVNYATGRAVISHNGVVAAAVDVSNLQQV